MRRCAGLHSRRAIIAGQRPRTSPRAVDLSMGDALWQAASGARGLGLFGTAGAHTGLTVQPVSSFSHVRLLVSSKAHLLAGVSWNVPRPPPPQAWL